MSRLLSNTALFIVCAVLLVACGSTTTAPTAPTPVSLTETFAGTINRNGAQTFPFVVQTAGTVTATLTALEAGDATTIGLSLGTWNGQVCQIILANDAAHALLPDGTVATTVIGTASAVGTFCVRVYDVGQLTDATPATFSLDVTHF
jgi:hypothetical protein